MNQANLLRIIDHYIEKFDEINAPGNEEYYKWQIIRRFKPMMDDALSSADEVFPVQLQAVRRLTSNLIDSYTQPFGGLVEFAKEDPAAVRGMFSELFESREKDVRQKQDAILRFLDKSEGLRAKYAPGSYLYKNDLHAVTGYLFMYDPDHQYLYKAEHCRSFADCIAFYDDWGSGRNTRLDVFFRMCDETVPLLKGNRALMEADASRFRIDPKGMHPDPEKHILLFDLIYCCSAYHLFDGIAYTVPKTGERKYWQERKEKARQLAAELSAAKEELNGLNQVRAFLDEALKPGTNVKHKLYGAGTVAGNDRQYLTIDFPQAGRKKLALKACVINALISVDDQDIQNRILESRKALSREDQIPNAVKRAENALAPYLNDLNE